MEGRGNSVECDGTFSTDVFNLFSGKREKKRERSAGRGGESLDYLNSRSVIFLL